MKIKKTYINPETAVVEVELQQIMATGSNPGNIIEGETTSSTGFEGLGKENEISSGSIWGEEE